MKKILYISIAIITLLYFGSELYKMIEIASISDVDAKISLEHLKDKGYRVVSYAGESDAYKLTVDKLLAPPFSVWWGLQRVNPEIYIGKTVRAFGFTVKNHPLDNMHGKSQTKVWVMVIDHKVIGGHSMPDSFLPLAGFGYSLDGQDLETVTNSDFQDWQQKWKNRFAKKQI